MAAVSQWEREAIGERTRDPLQHKRGNGERVGNIEFGYRLAADGKHLEPNPKRAGGADGHSQAPGARRNAARNRQGVERDGPSHPPRNAVAAGISGPRDQCRRGKTPVERGIIQVP